MIRLQWNALRVGDHVLVHDEDDTEMALVPGRVTMIQTAQGSNDVAIRLSGRGASKIVHPRRLAVHLDEFDPDSHCWRCDLQSPIARRAPRPARSKPAVESAT
jgi:hypothetical protein